ncbi:MAG: endonuclease/exonuclease/phosphatase family protein [Phycisphaerae bacterium]
MLNQMQSKDSLCGWFKILLVWTTAWVITTSTARAQEPPIGADEGRPQISWRDADQAIGRVAFVSGRVAAVGHAGRVHFINFHGSRRDVFKVVIFESYIDRFSDKLENLYKGKNIRVRGMVTTYAGSPQIQVTSPEQIEVLKEMPPTKPITKASISLGSEITVGTYNIRNLYDAVDDLYHNDDTTSPKPRQEMEKVAQVIRKINADVLALQEVENRGYLERFVEVFLSDMGYEHIVLIEGNDLRGSDVALLSRVPVGAVTSHRHLRFPDATNKISRFRRDLLRVEIEPADRSPFEVWVVHLKSSHDGRDLAERIRMGEAHMIRELADRRLKADPHAAFVVCGDFNDIAESISLEMLMGEGKYALTHFAEEVPAAQHVTYNREPYLSMIDFMLCSPAMAQRYVKGSFKIYGGTLEGTGSDHNPLVSRFRLGPKAQARATRSTEPAATP